MSIIGNVDTDPLLAERYFVQWDWLPNIAMDLVVPWLGTIMPLDVAGRLFLGICLLAPLAGVAWLHRVLFNRWSLHPLLAALFVHHGSLIAGMVNFSLGIGLVPAALAVWIRLRERGVHLRLLIGSGTALGLFFCHLVAFGAYGLLVLGYEIAHGRRRPRPARAMAADFAVAGLTGLLPLILFLRLVWQGDGALTDTGIVYGTLAWKLKALLSPLAQYSLPLDLLSLAVLTGLACWAWRRGWLLIHGWMAPGLSLLALVFLLAPKALWTGGVFDQRLAVLLAFMLVASTDVTLPKGVIGRLIPAAITALLLLRVGVLTSAWVDHRADLAEMRAAAAKMERGARVLVIRPAVETGQRLAPPRHRVFHHAVQLPSLPTLAVIETSAFVSTLYALPGQQPLLLKPPFDRLGGRGHVDVPTLDDLKRALTPSAAPIPPQIRHWTRDFDYVVMIYGYGPGSTGWADSLPLLPLLDGEILDLFRIVGD